MSWMLRSITSEGELAAMIRQVAGFRYQPRFGVLLVVRDEDEIWIKNTLHSILNQIYPYLELCVCDNASVRPHVPEALEDFTATDERVKVHRLPEKSSRAGALNAALSMATGDFVFIADPGDELEPDAVFRVTELLQRVEASVVYTDEDSVDLSGERRDPVFKPHPSPELLLSAPYTGRMCAVRRVLLGPEAFREGFEDAEEHDLLLRIFEKTGNIHHLPGVLYHRRVLPGGSDDTRAGTPPMAAVEDALARRGEDASVEPVLAKGLRVRRRIAGSPKVTVILSVPAGMDHAPAAAALEQRTSYPIHQLIVAGGGRETSPLAADHVSHFFPARALNLAAERAEGEYLAFIDGRAEVTDPGWLQEMLGQARRREVGCVGCKLVNPDGSLRHGGSLIDVRRLLGSPDETRLEADEEVDEDEEYEPLIGYVEEPVFEGEEYLPLVEYPFDFPAASVECMVVQREVFESAGGFDDENLPTAFYDLDLSFRLREAGLRNVYTPYASVACGAPRTLPGEAEITYVWRRWWEPLALALYYRWSPLHTEHRGLDGGVLAMLQT